MRPEAATGEIEEDRARTLVAACPRRFAFCRLRPSSRLRDPTHIWTTRPAGRRGSVLHETIPRHGPPCFRG